MVRFAGAMAVGDLKLSVARGTLLGMVNDKNPIVRVGVRYALHRLGTFTFSHDLEHSAVAAGPDAAGERGATAMVLGRMGDKSAIKILMVLRKDPVPAVREQASESLWRLGEMLGAEDLAGLVRSHYRDDQIVGLLGLAATHDANVREQIRAELSGIDTDVRLTAARALAMVGGPPYDIGYWIAVNGAKETDPKLRALAALAMGAIGRTDLQPTLRGLLNDPDPEVRIAAATAILQITPPERRPAATD